MELKGVKYSSNASAEFINTLRKRVDEYFRAKQISRHANFNMVLKTIFMLALFFTPLVFIILGTFESVWTRNNGNIVKFHTSAL